MQGIPKASKLLYLLVKFPAEWNDSTAVPVKFLTMWNSIIKEEKQYIKNCPTCMGHFLDQ